MGFLDDDFFETKEVSVNQLEEVSTKIVERGRKAKCKKDRALIKNKGDFDHDIAMEKDESWESYLNSLIESTGCPSVEGAVAILNSSAFALCSSKEGAKHWTSTFNMIGNFIKSFEPKDPVEGMLCAQAVVCQIKAFEYMGKASSDTSTQVTKCYTNAASKLLARSQSAIQTLANYRRGGSQKMIVEHINVSPGAQAAIGTFEYNANKKEEG